MKKLFLTLVTIAATSLAGFADTTLAEAYKALSGMSGMKETQATAVQYDQNITFKSLSTASVTSSASNVQNYRDCFIYMMENLPVRNMVIGANNMRELAAVYATPAGGGVYDVLLVSGDALSGNFSVSYGQTNAAGVKAIRSYQVNMDADQLVFSLPSGSGSSELMGMNE